MKQKVFLTASEIGEYFYCKRAWWLRLNGKLGTTPAMLEGSINHTRLSELLGRIRLKKLIAWLLVLFGVILAGVLAAFLSLA